MEMEYTRADVSQHKSVETGIWLIIGNSVYDVTKFLEEVKTHCEGQELVLGQASLFDGEVTLNDW